jgi:hypothetical protein
MCECSKQEHRRRCGHNVIVMGLFLIIMGIVSLGYNFYFLYYPTFFSPTTTYPTNIQYAKSKFFIGSSCAVGIMCFIIAIYGFVLSSLKT